MRERPAGLSDDDLVRGLADGWGLRARELVYLPVGAGGYHWAVDGQWFVTVSVTDLDRVERALGTAVALRESGLEFVLAPIRAHDGAAGRRFTPRHLLSVYPMVDGVAGDFGPHPAEDRERVLDLLIELHGAGAAPDGAEAPRTDLRLPGRAGLEAALDDLAGPWRGGPCGEPAREILAANAGVIHGWLAEFDRLAGAAGDPAGWVITHGEPHPGNVLHTPAGLLLIDWDTVLVAPAERDLWMLTDAMIGSATGEAGTEIRGRPVSTELIAFYRLWWMLADIAIYADELRREHGDGPDPASSLGYLANYFG
ncbi:phosphotransferase [Actinoplanes bogorensis]|uniref:Phosphotransferase n=1 Tax=Paractinoplanes bogorensis TaxID=1610840 RepID=A0ABS5YVS0_9ACTN|nr:phosphotransferase [Actinoplanes bogorensis]MBU2667544.1 phosphotransferase [Actinoplanes bogorensis]